VEIINYIAIYRVVLELWVANNVARFSSIDNYKKLIFVSIPLLVEKTIVHYFHFSNLTAKRKYADYQSGR
jgi:hypothetical protein